MCRYIYFVNLSLYIFSSDVLCFFYQEKLKAKQAEFEKELKKQTKQLKPRVLGCLWLHKEDQPSGAGKHCSLLSLELPNFPNFPFH